MFTLIGIMGLAPGLLVAQQPNRKPTSITLEFEPEDRGFVFFRSGPKADEPPTRHTIAEEMMMSDSAAWGTCVAYSPDGLTIAFGDGPWRAYCRIFPTPCVNENGGLIRLVDAKTNRLIRTLQPEKRDAHEYQVENIQYSSDGKLVISSGYDTTYEKDGFVSVGDLTAWDSETGQIRFQLLSDKDNSRFNTLISPDGRTVADSDKNGMIRLRDLAKGEEKLTLAAPEGGALNLDLAFSPDARILAAGYEKSGILIWDADAGRELARFAVPAKAGFHHSSVEFDFDRKGLALACLNRFDDNMEESYERYSEIDIYNVNKHEEIIKLSEGQGMDFNSLAWSPDGMILAIACDSDVKEEQITSGWIRIWDRATQKTRDIGKGDFGEPDQLVFSPDSQWLAVTGEWPLQPHSSVVLLEVSTGRKLADLDASSTLDGLKIALSPDGKTLASAGYSLMLWDLRNIATSP
ncbi:WD40 repeat domain-containing protein [Singulisphaera sp. PoT]|uniref:WD40 repeat domain-containing protein n=1 Tax=Singulisphaera sp. PoT TaxID=3411797 RepID=UPI003BF5E2F9